MMTSQSSARAIVAYEPEDGKPNWKLQDVTLRDLEPDELLVRMVSTGICHTDVVFSLWPKEQFPYPKVLGHEGAGYVEKAGANVKSAREGDSVLLSYSSCSTCKDCLDKHPAYCQQFAAINYGGDQALFTIADGSQSSGAFFGQSSFASYSIVKESSVVNVSTIVKDEEELKLLAPLGCGIQSGAGTITELVGATEKDSVVILGLGGVGQSAIMAAKLQGCKTIVGVDRITLRLDLAKEFGATHVVNTSDSKDLAEEIRSLTGGLGASVIVDTTGNMGVIQSAMDFTANRGQLVFLGVPPPDGFLNVHLIAWIQRGMVIRGSIEGDAIPADFVPRMIQWYRDGKLPIDKLVKFYPVKDYQLALADMHSGKTIKPVLIW